MEAKEWAEGLIAKNAFVFHIETYAVGRATKFFDGEIEVYSSPVNGKPVRGSAVLELDTGHALLADPEKWMELSKAEVRYFEALQEGFRGLLIVAAKNAKDSGVELEKGLAMLIAILRAQLAALEQG